VSNRIIKKKAD